MTVGPEACHGRANRRVGVGIRPFHVLIDDECYGDVTTVEKTRAELKTATAHRLEILPSGPYGQWQTVLCSGQRQNAVNRKAQQESGDHEQS